jgi:hypothetical protein
LLYAFCPRNGFRILFLIGDLEMSFSTFSAQGIVSTFLREFNMSVETFVNLQFEPGPRISRWIIERILSGDRPVNELTEGPRLIRLVQACRAFAQSMPIDPDWTDIRVREIMARDYRAAQNLEPEQPFIRTARAV